MSAAREALDVIPRLRATASAFRGHAELAEAADGLDAAAAELTAARAEVRRLREAVNEASRSLHIIARRPDNDPGTLLVAMNLDAALRDPAGT